MSAAAPRAGARRPSRLRAVPRRPRPRQRGATVHDEQVVYRLHNKLCVDGEGVGGAQDVGKLLVTEDCQVDLGVVCVCCARVRIDR